jgi:hypothetical protein
MALESLADRIDRLWKDTGRYTSERHFLRKCHISEGYLAQFRSRLAKAGKAEIASDKAVAMASELGISVDDLLGAHPLHLPDDEYPERAAAVGAARLLRYPESAIMSVANETHPHDPGVGYWFRRIEAAAAARPIETAPSTQRNRKTLSSKKRRY